MGIIKQYIIASTRTATPVDFQGLEVSWAHALPIVVSEEALERIKNDKDWILIGRNMYKHIGKKKAPKEI
jgi:hypothetical protein